MASHGESLVDSNVASPTVPSLYPLYSLDSWFSHIETCSTEFNCPTIDRKRPVGDICSEIDEPFMVQMPNPKRRRFETDKVFPIEHVPGPVDKDKDASVNCDNMISTLNFLSMDMDLLNPSASISVPSVDFFPYE